MKQYEEQDALKHADGIFRSAYYAYYRLLFYDDVIERINAKMYSIHSPAILTQEQAKHKRSTKPYFDKLPDLITKKDAAEQCCRYWSKVLHTVGDFLCEECDSFEIDLICAYYDLRKPLWLIGEEMHYSREAIRIKKDVILLRFTKYQEKIIQNNQPRKRTKKYERGEKNGT